jgi:hypothetical protein
MGETSDLIGSTINQLNKERLIQRSQHGPFWRRQFAREATSGQRAFDWVFGVGMPMVCVMADQYMFRGHSIFGPYKPFTYTLSFVSIVMMAGFLLLGKRLGGFNAVLAGLFGFGSLVSLGAGLLMLPLSVMGLLVLIGALGFTPLFSAFVYARSAVRAFRFASVKMDYVLLAHVWILSALFSFTIPWVVQAEVRTLYPERYRKRMLIDLD